MLSSENTIEGIEPSDCKSMPVEEFKKHIGKTNLTDKEAEELRDSLCALIEKVLDKHFEKFMK